MANFGPHYKYGILSHGVGIAVVIGLVLAEQLHPSSVLIASILLPVTVSGALMPDIDHHASKPNAMFRKIILGGVGFTVVFALIPYHGQLSAGVSVAHPLIDDMSGSVIVLTGITCIAVSLALGARNLFDRFRPKHRGITHNPLFALGMAAGLGLATFVVTSELSYLIPANTHVIVAILFMVGFFSHWTLDYVV